MARDATCRAVEGMHKHVLRDTGDDYGMSHVRKIMKKRGHAMKGARGTARQPGRQGGAYAVSRRRQGDLRRWRPKDGSCARVTGP